MIYDAAHNKIGYMILCIMMLHPENESRIMSVLLMSHGGKYEIPLDT
jgi:hypothetical protein